MGIVEVPSVRGVSGELEGTFNNVPSMADGAVVLIRTAIWEWSAIISWRIRRSDDDKKLRNAVVVR